MGDGGQVDPTDLAEFRRVLANVKRLSSWLDEVITISTFEEEILIFAGYLDPGCSVTTLPEGAVDLDADAVACGAFSTFTATTIPAAE